MSAGGGGGAAEGDVELNIAPIVDCFTVLIAYMLVSMSYIQLSIFEAGVAASPPPDAAPSEPPPQDKLPVTFNIEVADGNRVELKLTGGPTNINETIPVEAAGDGTINSAVLNEKLTFIKTTYPTVTEVNLSAAPAVRYKSVVKIIQAVKAVLPKVFLASS
ncbi:MAG: biopolymer transporter ExbD [Bdellovibrionales bacterium]|nr:biopolymer transporter ExbD [Bdellovibrionales bacterium]